jgi:hypothetical protein
MPTHDFKDIGDVLNYEFLQGTIATIDTATDTCTVSVGGSVIPALLFWHSSPDDVLRSNGAIEGAAENFGEGDTVVVMKKIGGSELSDSKVLYGGGGGDWHGGVPYFAGHNLYGCLGNGQDCEVVDDIIYEEFGVLTDTITVSLDSSWYMDWVFCQWWNREYLAQLLSEGWIYQYSVPGDSCYIATFNKYDSVPVVKSHYYSYVWPRIGNFTALPLNKIVRAVTANYVSFLIDSSGNMYCAGSNSSGALGIGQATGVYTLNQFTGELTADPTPRAMPEIESSELWAKMKPIYYSTSFIQVPGKWKQVYCDGLTTIAIDSEGNRWVAGMGYTATLTRNDEVYAAAGGANYLYKETVKDYKVYALSATDAPLALFYPITPYYTISKEQWEDSYGGLAMFAVWEWIYSDNKGSVAVGEVYFKPKGTLWYVPNSGVYSQVMSGNTWKFVVSTSDIARQDGYFRWGQAIAVAGE